MKSQKYVDSPAFQDLIFRLLFLYSIPLKNLLINYLVNCRRIARHSLFLTLPGSLSCRCGLLLRQLVLLLLAQDNRLFDRQVRHYFREN